jgi:hypothetical protein
MALSFSPDGARLVSASREETSALIWEVADAVGRPLPAGGKLGRDGLDRSWEDLAGGDAAAAHRAAWRLAGSPDESVPFLKTVLRPVARPAAPAVARLIADLNDDAFAVREKATQELDSLGDAVAADLAGALAGKPPAEQRRRLQALLDRLRDPGASPARLRELRAVTALEQAATPEARQLLEQLGGGAAGARLTDDARAALRRLVRPAGGQP